MALKSSKIRIKKIKNCRSNGEDCGKYKDKEGKNDQKLKNGHKKVNFQNFQKLFKKFVFLCHKDPLNKTN